MNAERCAAFTRGDERIAARDRVKAKPCERPSAGLDPATCGGVRCGQLWGGSGSVPARWPLGRGLGVLRAELVEDFLGRAVAQDAARAVVDDELQAGEVVVGEG